MDIFGLLILGAIALYAIFVYNGLVRARQMVREAWSGIDVQLKRRADLIPNLVETVKGYASHEKETLREVTEMRTRAQAVPSGDIAGRAAAEGMLSQALGKLFAVAEDYPELRANENLSSFRKHLRPPRMKSRWPGATIMARRGRSTFVWRVFRPIWWPTPSSLSRRSISRLRMKPIARYRTSSSKLERSMAAL